MHTISLILISDKDKCLLDCNNISNETIYHLIEDGSISFSDSDVKVRNYQFTYNDLILFIKINEKDTAAIINNVNYTTTDCKCDNSKETTYQLLYQPNSIVLKNLQELTLSIKKEAQCELDCFNISGATLDSMFTNGTILFNQSYPYKVPNPIYFIHYKNQKGNFLFWVEQGATKTRLKHVVKYNPQAISPEDFLEEVFEKSYELKDCNCN